MKSLPPELEAKVMVIMCVLTVLVMLSGVLAIVAKPGFGNPYPEYARGFGGCSNSVSTD